MVSISSILSKSCSLVTDYLGNPGFILYDDNPRIVLDVKEGMPGIGLFDENTLSADRSVSVRIYISANDEQASMVFFQDENVKKHNK